MDNTTPQTPVEQVNDSMQQATTPQDTSATQGPDNAPQTPTPNPTDPSATPQSAAPQNGPQQPQQPDASKNPAQPQAQAAQTPAQHPMVQKASILRQVAEALAGGPRYQTSIDPQSGKTTRTAIPMSGRDIGMAIALEALSGGIAGAAAKGPNATGQAAAAGLKQGEQIAQGRQEQQQQADSMAQGDYARQMQTFHNNLQMLQISKQLGGADFDTNQKVASQYGDLYKEMQNHYAPYILGTGGESDAAKYHATSATAIPTGRVIPVLNPQTGKQDTGGGGSPQWQLEYAFIDPSFKGDNLLNAQDKSILQKYGQQGFVDSSGKPSKLPENFQLGANLALALKHRAVSLEMSDDMLQGYYKQTDMDPKALVEHMKDDPSAADALGKFQAYLAQTDKDGRRLNYTEAIGHLGAKDPQAAGQVLNLLGGTATVSKFDADAANKAEADKKTTDLHAKYDGPLNPATAESIISDKDSTPEQKQRATDFLSSDNNRQVNLAGRKGYAAGAGHEQGSIDTRVQNHIPVSGSGKSGNAVADMIKDPNVSSIPVDPSEQKLTNGVNESYLSKIQAASPNLAALVNQIGHGQQMLSAYSLAKNDGQVLGSMVARAFPDYQFQKTEGFKKTYDSFTSGADSKQIEAGNTTYRHLASAFDAASDPESYNPLSKANADYHAAVDKVMEEAHSAYTPGVMHEEEAKRAADYMKSSIPWRRTEGFKMVANLLSDKSGEKQNTYRRAKPTPRVADMDIISPDAQAAFKKVTGKDIGTNGYVQGSLSGHPSNVPATPPSGAAGIAKFGGVPYYVDANQKPLSKAPAQ